MNFANDNPAQDSDEAAVNLITSHVWNVLDEMDLQLNFFSLGQIGTC